MCKSLYRSLTIDNLNRCFAKHFKSSVPDAATTAVMITAPQTALVPTSGGLIERTSVGPDTVVTHLRGVSVPNSVALTTDVPGERRGSLELTLQQRTSVNRYPLARLLLGIITLIV
ncbi:hypothetical protein EVAR_57077_1 [Eumeta japonica]|uniref:Uncharacterized protein n=1 Tax=Eumeta variegata TaxID=151549 RepID=A0A4C1Y9G5_EUMVA|nr:hypothetical protein EVAR_57077_1 [Eumeta japonica]